MQDGRPDSYFQNRSKSSLQAQFPLETRTAFRLIPRWTRLCLANLSHFDYDARMTDEVQNILLTHLRAIREDVAEVKARLSNLEGSVATVMQHQGHLANQIAQIQVSMDRQAARFGRIEERLALVDQP